ncbi:MAG TPA: hypothetical protein VN673_10210, partial [Clostridia bacterium]|nr:hypothetical protein [Clostridia bacterium]
AAEVERLRAQAVLLESRRVTMLLARANEQEAARKLEDLKFRGRGLLAAEDYLWPDDLPFVRIPKAALPSISMKGGPDTPARLESKIDQLLDLSPSEQQAVDQIFSDYFDGIDQLLANNLYETNQATGVKLPTGAESIVFVLQPMGPKIRAAMDELCTNLTAVLGKERWSMVQPHKFEFTHYEQVRLLGYTKFAWDQTQEVTVNIFARPGSEPTVSWSQNTGVGISPVPLHYFFQDQPTDLIGLSQGPPALLNRVKQWLATQAAARLSNPVSK